MNLVLSASHREARRRDVLLVGQNEKTPTVVQDMAGIRVVRLARGARPPAPVVEQACRVGAIPVAKRATVVLSHRLDDPDAGEQFLVKARLVTDAGPLGYPARVSSRVFLADGPEQTEPGGRAARIASWNGHVSKFTGFNCLPGSGPQQTRKFGIAAIRRRPRGPLHVNLVAVSAAPRGGAGSNDALPIDRAATALEITRFPAG